MQMGKVCAALARYDRAGGLFVSVLTNPTMGGVAASFASLGDIIFAEPKALVGFAGPRVVKALDGKLWFFSIDAYSVLDPQHLPFNKLPPPTDIEQITTLHIATVRRFRQGRGFPVTFVGYQDSVERTPAGHMTVWLHPSIAVTCDYGADYDAVRVEVQIVHAFKQMDANELGVIIARAPRSAGSGAPSTRSGHMPRLRPLEQPSGSKVSSTRMALASLWFAT